MKKFSIIFTCFFVLFMVSPTYASTIDTSSSWSGSGIGNFGEDNYPAPVDSGVYATYGQTFQLGASDDNILDSITFFINDHPVSEGPVEFSIYLYRWDGTKSDGDVLYASPLLATSQISEFEEFTVYTGGIELTRGIDYVVFVSTSNYFDGLISFGSMGYTADPYPNGYFVSINNKDDFSRLFIDNWRSIAGIDLAFRLELSAISDLDGDSIPDEVDNCPEVLNTNQIDSDLDGIGDLCDQDADGDGFFFDVDDCNDNDPLINPNACDIKKDGIDQNCDGQDRKTGRPCGK